MQIEITEKGVELEAQLKAHIKEVLPKHIEKYFPTALSAEVVVSKEMHKALLTYHVEVRINEGVKKGKFIKVTAVDKDPYAVIDTIDNKLKHKLRDYKDKLQTQHSSVPGISSRAYIYNEYEIGEPHPTAIEEKVIDIKKLTLEDAVMHRDLMSLKAFLFINFETGRLNMLYENNEGNLVLVDTPQELNAPSK